MAEAESIDFGTEGIIPVVVQDETNGEVLVIAYANKESLEQTLATGIVTFWSRSRNELWVKGDTSGNRYFASEVRVNCEGNSLMYLAKPEAGGMCHILDEYGEAMKSCFYRTVDLNGDGLEFRVREG